MMVKGVFLHNPKDLNSDIPGGVQLCSKEFLRVIEKAVDELLYFEVNFSKSFLFRFKHNLKLDNYNSYLVEEYADSLISFIKKHQITHVFINKTELIRFSKLIKRNCPSVKIIIMSHGNESGDFLNDLTELIPQFSGLRKAFGKLKLGLNLYTESYYRKRYIDLVGVMSEEESTIEKWLGQNNSFYIPRLINKSTKISRNPINHLFGYVGTLNHNPNYSALIQLFDQLKEMNLKPTIQLVGSPSEIGEEFAKKYSFVNYLGPLNDLKLLEVVKSWAFFINPIFNYSRGASMKLAKAIEWEIPIISTKAGRRGYIFPDGELIETENNVAAFAKKMEYLLEISPAQYTSFVKDVISIKSSSLSAEAIGLDLKNELLKLN